MPGVNRQRLGEFLWWMCERQRIWHRRHVEEQKPPWTTDEILQEYHFCNIHRELDRGTQYYLDNIRDLNPPTDEDILLNTIFYRFFNRPETMRTIGWPIPKDKWSPSRVAESLHVVAHSNPVFSSAYRVTTQAHADADNKIDNIVYGIFRDDILENWDYYTDAILDAPHLQDAWGNLQEIPGVGDFLAYEIVTDLNYIVLPFSEDDFVNIGPGAEKGLDYIFDEVSEDNLRWLCDNQATLFEEFDLDYPYWEQKSHLTLRDWEHAACEFRKYVEIAEEGAEKRRFDVPDYNQDTFDDFL